MSLLDRSVGRAGGGATDSNAGRQAEPWETRRSEHEGEAGREPDSGDGQQKINVGDAERMVSVAAGAIVGLLGLSRRSLPGLLVAGVGAGLVYRGATGHCHAYDALGIDTAADQDGTEEQIRRRGIHVTNALLINRPAAELYRFWRNFENLPRIMDHLEEVRVIDDRRSHWAARLPRVAGGARLEWDAEVTRDDPDSLIAWRSVPGSDIQSSGEVRFEPAPGDRGTAVRVFMNYVPPGGVITTLLAPLLNKGTMRLIREDMRNFKRIMEAGEIPTIIGQPHGTCTGQGRTYSESPW